MIKIDVSQIWGIISTGSKSIVCELKLEWLLWSVLMGLCYSHPSSVTEASQGQKEGKGLSHSFSTLSHRPHCASNPIPCLFMSVASLFLPFMTERKRYYPQFSTWGNFEEESSHFQQVFLLVPHLRNGRMNTKICEQTIHLRQKCKHYKLSCGQQSLMHTGTGIHCHKCNLHS